MVLGLALEFRVFYIIWQGRCAHRSVLSLSCDHFWQQNKLCLFYL